VNGLAGGNVLDADQADYLLGSAAAITSHVLE
jgi:hypothetical protein